MLRYGHSLDGEKSRPGEPGGVGVDGEFSLFRCGYEQNISEISIKDV